MDPVACLGVSPDELNEQVAGAVWARWVEAEPDLAAFTGLEAVHALRGSDNDPPFGALLRLAAQDGGDDPLAAIALAHQLEYGARHMMHWLRDMAEDIDHVVMSALWERIRTFPWRRRTHRYAANLILDTRGAVLRELGERRGSGGSAVCVPVDPQMALVDWLSTPEAPCRWAQPPTCEQTSAELIDVLHWALASGVIDRDDAELTLELIAAGDEVSDQETPWTRRGVCSQAAVMLVAERRGVCGKTVRRRRDRIVAALRDSVPRYFAEVA